MAVGSELAQLLEARRRKQEENVDENESQPPASPSSPAAKADKPMPKPLSHTKPKPSPSASSKPWPQSMSSKPSSSSSSLSSGNSNSNKLNKDRFPFTSPKSSQQLQSPPQGGKGQVQVGQTTKGTASFSSFSLTSPTSNATQKTSSSTQSKPAQSPPSPSQPIQTQPATVKAPSPSTNTKWDQANLDAGIPTPSFLLEFRKNLKSRKDTERGAGALGPSESKSDVGVEDPCIINGGGDTEDNHGQLEAAVKETTPVIPNEEVNTIEPEVNTETISKPKSDRKINPIQISNNQKKKFYGRKVLRQVKDAEETTAVEAASNTPINDNQSLKEKEEPKESLKSNSAVDYSTPSGNNSKPSPSIDLLSTKTSRRIKERKEALLASKNGYLAKDLPSTSIKTKPPSSNTPAPHTSTTISTTIASTIASTTASPRNNDISARRSRLIARTNSNSADSNTNTTKETYTTEKDPPSSPVSDIIIKESKSSLRRERILAKVRANSTFKHKDGKSISSNSQQSEDPSSKSEEGSSTGTGLATKIKVTSPTAEEVEMLFDDGGFLQTNSSGEKNEFGQVKLVREESMDSISREIQKPKLSPLMISAAAKKSQNANGVDEDDAKHNFASHASAKSMSGPLSQQQRLHMASTPKIRGNCQYRRDNFEENEVKDDEEEEQQQQPTPQQQQYSPLRQPQQEETTPRVSKQNKRRSSHNNTNTSTLAQCNPSPQSQPQYLGHFEDEKLHNIHQTYPINERAPSTISAISIPSCFPQETSFGHLQQPMLGSGNGGFTNHHDGSGAFGNTSAIIETTSFNSGNSGSLSSTNLRGGFNNTNTNPSSPGMGISAFSPGVENENRRLREQIVAMQKRLEEKDAIISQLMKRIGDLENNSARATDTSKSSGRAYSIDQDSYALSSVWDHSRPPSDVYAPCSTDTDNVSMSSPPHQHHSNINVKKSPSTTHTSSTASMTTSNSGKSRGSNPKVRRSPHRRENSSSNSGGDDRRFQC